MKVRPLSSISKEIIINQKMLYEYVGGDAMSVFVWSCNCCVARMFSLHCPWNEFKGVLYSTVEWLLIAIFEAEKTLRFFHVGPNEPNNTIFQVSSFCYQIVQFTVLCQALDAVGVHFHESELTYYLKILLCSNSTSSLFVTYQRGNAVGLTSCDGI